MTHKPKEEKKPQIKRAAHHDIFFKEGYSDPRFAKELFQLALTKREFSAFNWDSLTPEKDTFQGLRADLVFSVNLKNDPKKRVKFCLLLEHKSQYDPKSYCQILKYKIAFIVRSLEETGEAWPVFAVLFYHGPTPWPRGKSLKKSLWGHVLDKIPSSLRKDMLDYGLRIVDTHDPRVERAIKNKRTKSRGFLNILKRTWTLKPSAEELKKALSLFDNWTGDRDSLSLGVGNYFWQAIRGMKAELWEELERDAVKQGIFSKGGYMNTREYIEEKGRQKGIQQGIQKGMQKERQQVVLNMLKEKIEIASICKVTGLSEKEVKQLKNKI